MPSSVRVMCAFEYASTNSARFGFSLGEVACWDRMGPANPNHSEVDVGEVLQGSFRWGGVPFRHRMKVCKISCGLESCRG